MITLGMRHEDVLAVINGILHSVGKNFTNKETFGQFPLQVDGFRDIHESLEAATAQGEIETVSTDVTTKSGQEVCIFSIFHIVITFTLYVDHV